MSRERIKREAKRLQKLLPSFFKENSAPYPLSACQELAAQAAGYQNLRSVPVGSAAGEDAADVREDRKALMRQLDIAVASAVSKGVVPWADVDWDSWLTLVDIHDDINNRTDDMFAYPALVSNIAMRLHLNPLDLYALQAAVDMHEFPTHTAAEQYVARILGHVIECVAAFDEVDSDDLDVIEEVTETINAADIGYWMTGYLVMAALEQGLLERAADGCRMALMCEDTQLDPAGILESGIAAALEVDNFPLAVRVLAALSHRDTLSYADMAKVASDAMENEDDPGECEYGFLAVLAALQDDVSSFPSHLFVYAAVIKDALEGDVLARPLPEVVGHPVVDENAVGPWSVNATGNVTLAVARFIAREPTRLDKLNMALDRRRKLH